ncbi:MAG: hypothetical protein KatS3mg076_0378 [Candidatus Binatia bacterium]|nr:MAG: hypothetical protein KatS3mg076_0378 [Candidatus Binatia bacterium]
MKRRKRRLSGRSAAELGRIAAELIETAVDAIVTIDENGTIELFNPAAERMFGYRAEEVLGQNVGILMPSPFREEHDDYIRRYLETGEKRIIGIGREVSALHRSGRTFPVDLAVSEVRLRGRRIFTGVMRDLTERKRVEDELRQQRDFAERLLDTAPVLIVVVDREGRIRHLNRRAEDLGLAAGNDAGEGARAEDFAELLGRVGSGEAGGYRASLVDRAGRVREIEWHAAPLKGSGGETFGILLVGQDVTERRRAERRITVQHAVTRCLAESRTLPEATPRILEAVCQGFSWDLGEIWHVEPSQGSLHWEGMWSSPELDAGKFGALSRRLVFHLADGLPGRVWAERRPLWIPEVGEDPEFLRASLARDLGLRTALAVPLRSGTQVTGVMALFRRVRTDTPDAEVVESLEALGRQIGDFIERKRAEDMLLQLAAIVESCEEAVIGCDLAGRISGWNRGAARMLGHAASDARGKSIELFVAPERLRRFREVFRKIASGDSVEEEETLWVAKDGRRLDVALSASPVRDTTGLVTGVSIVARDVTEKRRAEAKLREYQELVQRRERLADLGAIAAKLAHDLGNPLGALSMQAQLILRRARRDPSQPVSSVEAAAEQIVNEANRLNQVLRELLSLVREERLQVEEIDLGSFLRTLVELWSPFAQEQGIELRYEESSAPVTVQADREKLRRVFDNLVKNALEALDRTGGEVVLRLEIPERDKVRVWVADNGSGIPEHVRPFELFETSKPHGTGLGLPIAKQIVLAHGGQIGFVRREPKGTAFFVDLPRGDVP